CKPFSSDMWQLVVPLLLVANETRWLDSVLAKIHSDRPFQGIISLRHSRERYDDRELFPTWPCLTFEEGMDFYVRGAFNSEMIALVWLTGMPDLDADLWRALDSSLLNMRKVRLLLVTNWENRPTTELAVTAQNLSFIHVAVIARERRIYRLQPYAPELWLEVEPSRDRVFEKIRNFHGSYILTLPDQFAPRSIVYRDPKTGKLAMSGYVYQFLHEFIKRYNFTFKWERPLKPGDRMTMFLMRNMTLNNTINMPISLCGFERPSELGVFSSVVDMEKWVVVVPCAREISTAEIYWVVVSKRFLMVLVMFYYMFTILDMCFEPLLLRKRVDWTNLLLNERMVSGILGQSFKMCARHATSSRVTNATLFFLGMVLSSIYAAHLKTLLTKHPTGPRISDFNQLKDAPVSVFFDVDERFYLDKFEAHRGVDAIRSRINFVNTSVLHKLRSKVNTSLAFSALTSEWLIVAKRQELYKHPAHCYEPGLWIISTNVLLSLPMQANAIYEQPLNELIHQVQSTGLLEHWKQKTLRKMVSIGMISHKDPFTSQAFKEFRVVDLMMLWTLLGTGLLLACLVFLGELLVDYLMRKY
ncbi:hypothetical protein KR018_009838, partial [Drosophila ironensis]